MFNRTLVFVMTLAVGSLLANANGYTSSPSGKHLVDENSTPIQTKRAKTANNSPDSETPGPQANLNNGVQTVEEDPAFLAALDELMSKLEPKTPADTIQQELDFDMACSLAAERASADYAARTPALQPRKVVKELFPDPEGSPAEPKQKKRAINHASDDESVHATHEETPEDEDDLASIIPLAPTQLDDVTDIGLRIKLLANVYSGKMDSTANIFVPQYVIRVAQPNGSVKKMKGFLKTDKNEICIFASGGTQNHWEKSIGKVYNLFFGQKVRIIRWHWLYKQLNRKMPGKNPLEAYVGKETDLHSELYYSLFFQHFFLPSLKQKYEGSLKTLGIRAFTWWEICDMCERRFPDQRNLCESNGLQGYTCDVAAVRKYSHTYFDSIATTYRVAQHKEQYAWQNIWEQVIQFVNKYSHSTGDKRNFWTKTADGLELCKWLGQAFRENMYTLSAETVKPGRRGDVLHFYHAMSDTDKKSLVKLLDYLREENWELSCWYNFPYYDPVQGGWKAYAKQVVRPHFGWQLISEPPADGTPHECQMCGNKNVINVYWVYHPKFRVTNKYFELSEDQQNATEQTLGISYETAFDNLPAYLQFKRRQSIVVGSECLKTLELHKADLEMFRQKMSDETRLTRFMDANEKHNQDDELKRAESKNLLNWMTKTYKKTKKPLTMQLISRSQRFGNAADIHPLMDILIQNKQVEKVDKKYVIRNLDVSGNVDK